MSKQITITMKPAYIPGWDIKYCSNFGMGAMFIPQAWGWSRAYDAAWELWTSGTPGLAVGSPISCRRSLVPRRMRS